MGMLKNLIKSADKRVDFRKLTKFGIVGVINTAVDWLAFIFLREVLGVEPRIAQVIAQALAVANSYILNKRWTFRDKGAPGKSIFKFVAVQGASLLIGYLSMILFHDTLGIDPYISRIFIIGVTVSFNYFGNKLFVFK